MKILAALGTIVVVNFCAVSAYSTFEFENALSQQQESNTSNWRYRSKASEDKSIYIIDELGDTTQVELRLCARPESGNVSVTFDFIQYSNDGATDTVTLKLDGTELASFETPCESNGGNNWNVFWTSNSLGSKELPKGDYTLTIITKTDQYGVELDMLRFTTVGQMKNHAFVCGAQIIVYNDFDLFIYMYG